MNSNKHTSEFCAEQVMRLEGQDFFQQLGKIAMSELIRSVIYHADSEAHIEEMVTAWINSTRQMLHPSQVAELAQRTTKRKPTPLGCAHCEGTGWRPDKQSVTVTYDDETSETFTYDCVRRCNCELGRQLAPVAKTEAEAPKPAQDRLKKLDSIVISGTTEAATETGHRQPKKFLH